MPPRVARRPTAAANSTEAADEPSGPAVLLVAADWRSRALTLAQLQEEGYAVDTATGVRDAVRQAVRRRAPPAAVVVHAHGDPDATPECVAGLLVGFPGVPAVVVADALGDWEAVRPRTAALLRRPVTIGQVVAALRRSVRQ
jgi:hypothetical protein